jgi:hypothetical protein
MKALIAPAILGLALAGASPAAAPTKTTASAGMVCQKTGARVDACCCIEKDGAMICTLTGETVSSCCCESE